MAEAIKPVRLVVANTGPIVAAMLGDCLEKLPLALSKIHIPNIELEEWKGTLAQVNQKLPEEKRLDIPSLVGRWTQQGTLVLHELTPAQEARAQAVTLRIHPDYMERGKFAVDGAAVVLARTLVDLGQAQALLADERHLRRWVRDGFLRILEKAWIFAGLWPIILGITTNNTKRNRREILAQIEQIPAIVEGKLAPRRDGNGKVTGQKLQRWRDGRNQTLHVPAKMEDKFREATEGYRRFEQLAQEYVLIREQEVIAPEQDAKKKPTKR